jgi:hypothetical protein
MKKVFLAVVALLVYGGAMAQDSASAATTMTHGAFSKDSYTASIGFGFVNGYRAAYDVPSGFEKGTPSGFAPFYFRGEYAVSNSVSIGVGGAYNVTHFNSFQLYEGYNGVIRRSRTNKWRLFNVGVMGYYHMGHLLKVNRLDPYVGVGLSLNNITQSAFPVGDTTIEQKEHKVSPYLKAGARYYISNQFSVYAEAGYDQLSAFSVGFSCRFFGTRKAHEEVK